MAMIKCWCGRELNVGDELRAVVSHCYHSGKSCEDLKNWGSAATRVDHADEAAEETAEKPGHVLQLRPDVDGAADQLRREVSASRGGFNAGGIPAAFFKQDFLTGV